MDLIIGPAVGFEKYTRKVEQLEHYNILSHKDIKSFRCGVFLTAFVTYEKEHILNFQHATRLISIDVPNGKKIEQLAVSPYTSTIFLKTNDSTCYVWSSHFKSLIPLRKCQNQKSQFEKISVGAKQTIVLSKDGMIFTVDDDVKCLTEVITARSVSLKTVISDICCGNEHTILLSQNGTVLTFGSGTRGQLGHGSTLSEKNPRIVDALDGLIMHKISAGGWHSLAISESGDLYIWGWNKFGQLGLGDDTETEFYPQIVSFARQAIDPGFSTTVITASCGTCHTVALTIVCNSKEGVCMYSDKETKEGREKELENNMVLTTGTNRTETKNPHLMQHGLWASTLAFVSIALTFSAIGAIFSVVNSVMSPVEFITGIKGLYVWNGCASGFCLCAMIVWSITFKKKLSKNVLDTSYLETGWSSEDTSTLGYSYWLILAALVVLTLNITIIILLTLEPWIKKQPKRNEASKTEGIIMLY